jgi:hypothetical protein
MVLIIDNLLLLLLLLSHIALHPALHGLQPPNNNTGHPPSIVTLVIHQPHLHPTIRQSGVLKMVNHTWN